MKWVQTQWDRCGAWVCIVAGAMALLAGWIGVSSTAYPAEQLPYILSGGIAGLFLLGLGAMLWLSADLRDEWHKLDRIEAVLHERGVGEGAPANGAGKGSGAGRAKAAERDADDTGADEKAATRAKTRPGRQRANAGPR